MGRRHNFRAHFWQSLANYNQQVLGLIIGIALARLLQPVDFGKFAYATSVVGIFLIPASWSLAQQVVAEIKKNPEIATDALWISHKVFFARILLSLAACIYLGLTQDHLTALLGAIIALPQIAGEFVAIFRSTLEGRGDFKVNFFDSILTALLTAGIALPLSKAGFGPWALAIPGIPLIACQLLLFGRLSGYHLIPKQPKSSRSYLKTGCMLWFYSLSENAMSRADKFFLGTYSNMNELGIYNRALNYAPMSGRILNSLIATPMVAALANTETSEAKIQLLGKSSIMLFLGGLLNFVLLWWFSEPLVPMVFGHQWSDAVPVFKALAPLSLVASFSYLLVAISLAKREYTSLAIVRIMCLVGFLLSMFWLGPQIDAIKTAWIIQLFFLLQIVALIFIRFYSFIFTDYKL